jgi:hypothetical protein
MQKNEQVFDKLNFSPISVVTSIVEAGKQERPYNINIMKAKPAFFLNLLRHYPDAFQQGQLIVQIHYIRGKYRFLSCYLRASYHYFDFRG